MVFIVNICNLGSVAISWSNAMFSTTSDTTTYCMSQISPQVRIWLDSSGSKWLLSGFWATADPIEFHAAIW